MSGELTRWLSGGMDPDEAMTREMLRAWVARAVLCPVRRTMLDLKRVVLIEAGPRHGSQILSAEAWDDLGADLLEAFAEIGVTPKVIDARLMPWSDRSLDFEELGVYRDVMTRFAGDEQFARWCALRYPWGNFDVAHEREAYELLRRFAPGDRVRLRWSWNELPEGTTGRTVGTPYELGAGRLDTVQFIELDDRRLVVVPLRHLEPAPRLTTVPDPSPEPEPPAA